MLNSLEIEKELLLRCFSLEVDNTHAKGFKHDTLDELIYIKVGKSKKDDPVKPVYEQPLVIHWAFAKHPAIKEISALVGDINLNYKNHNMKGFAGPLKSDTPHGVAFNITSGIQLDAVLSILGTDFKKASAYDEITEEFDALKKLPETTKQAVIDARLGQGKYRNQLIELWSGCSVTGLTNNRLLRASHIYPWKLSNNIERLDKFNGLLLTPNLDQSFDQGLISFDADGKIIIKATAFNKDELSALNINKDMKLRLINEQHKHYLQKHRQLHRFE
ncbi:MAG: hypothetical protein CTY12_01865 [Methylotenera sp.]|nr:MAG: hypothetical protein CTY12_01865 [Methylotenera sp.]